MIELLYPEYASAIRKTAAKLALFRKDDGSFSYKKNHSSATSQGAPVAVPNTNEGDVNATVIGTNNFTLELFQVLPVSRVPFCLTKERYVFYKLLSEISPESNLNDN